MLNFEIFWASAAVFVKFLQVRQFWLALHDASLTFSLNTRRPMMPEQTPRLAPPLNQSDFVALRTCGAGDVDKTALIEKLCRDRAKVFLARPRRFGKSLLVSTIGSLFAHGLRDFQGLAILRRWSDGTYPVVRLDFLEIKEFISAQEFSEKTQD